MSPEHLVMVFVHVILSVIAGLVLVRLRLRRDDDPMEHFAWFFLGVAWPVWLAMAIAWCLGRLLSRVCRDAPSPSTRSQP